MAQVSEPLVVAPECAQLGLRAGSLVLRNLRVGPAEPALREEIARECAAVRKRFADASAIRACPEVVAFQEILRRVGVNPRRVQSSVERLLNCALKRCDLPAISNVVDAYNLVSIRSCCSLGAHDLDRVALPVSLRFFTANEPVFTPLGGSAPVSVGAGEYGYVDARGAILCRLDVVQADFSKVTAETKNVLLIVEGTVAHSPEVLRQTLTDAANMVQRHCGGVLETVVYAQSAGSG